MNQIRIELDDCAFDVVYDFVKGEKGVMCDNNMEGAPDAPGYIDSIGGVLWNEMDVTDLLVNIGYIEKISEKIEAIENGI
jgi:hypothetical protein